MYHTERKITIRFSGRTAEAHKVPASVLNQVLSGLQRAIHLLAMQHQEIEVREKDRVSREVEDKYILLCEPPQQGSVVMLASLGDPGSDLFAASDIEAVANNLEAFCRGAQVKDEATVRRIMPDRGRRKRLMDALGKTVPKGGTGIRVEVGRGGAPFLISQVMQPALRELASSSSAGEEVQTVTGRLVRIDFEERKVTLQYSPAGRELECFYEESVEEMLLDRPRELIQVTGVIRLDESGLPKKIVDVEEIRELDLSRFYREMVKAPGFVLMFHPPLTLEPALVEEDQLIMLKDDLLGIDVVAPTGEELAESLDEEILMLWRNYAMAHDSDLSPKALALKRNLRNRITEARENG